MTRISWQNFLVTENRVQEFEEFEIFVQTRRNLTAVLVSEYFGIRFKFHAHDFTTRYYFEQLLHLLSVLIFSFKICKC